MDVRVYVMDSNIKTNRADGPLKLEWSWRDVAEGGKREIVKLRVAMSAVRRRRWTSSWEREKSEWKCRKTGTKTNFSWRFYMRKNACMFLIREPRLLVSLGNRALRRLATCSNEIPSLSNFNLS